MRGVFRNANMGYVGFDHCSRRDCQSKMSRTSISGEIPMSRRKVIAFGVQESSRREITHDVPSQSP